MHSYAWVMYTFSKKRKEGATVQEENEIQRESDEIVSTDQTVLCCTAYCASVHDAYSPFNPS